MFSFERLIPGPRLVVDAERCKKNIASMANKFRAINKIFRPHFKTHQSLEVGRWFLDEGVDCITVSSVTMAKAFAQDGWKDITLGIPFYQGMTEGLKSIPASCQINVVVDSAEAINHIPVAGKERVSVFIKVDTGYHRAGVAWNSESVIAEIISKINQKQHLRFTGFLTHDGHTYQAGSVDEIHAIRTQSNRRLKVLKQSFAQYSPILSVGDTPSCTLSDAFEDMDEVRPGNFVFYDMQQAELGVCSLDQIAAVMQCPVMSKNYPEGRIIIHGGGVHFSKDYFINQGKRVFGKVFLIENDTLIEPSIPLFVDSLSQEHGIIQTTPEMVKSLQKYSEIAVIPAHICLTVSCQSRYMLGEHAWTQVV